MLKNKVIFVLLKELIWSLLDSLDNLNATVASNQIEIQCLTGFVLNVLEFVRVILEDPVDSLLSLNAECRPFAAHQTYKA